MFTTLKENVAQLVCNFVDMKFPKHGHAARETQLEYICHHFMILTSLKYEIMKC